MISLIGIMEQKISMPLKGWSTWEERGGEGRGEEGR
jgi:hypothetical protein